MLTLKQIFKRLSTLKEQEILNQKEMKEKAYLIKHLKKIIQMKKIVKILKGV